MDQGYRVCKRKGHDEQVIYHICTVLECNQHTRWCCTNCIKQGIHNHEKPNNSHVMRTNDLLLKLKSQSEKFEENQGQNTLELLQTLKKIVIMCQELENSIVDFRKYIESQISNITQSKEVLKSNFNNLVIDNYEQLDDIKINELIQINLQYVFPNRKILPLNNIRQQLYQIESIIKDYQENNKDNSELIIDLKNRKYLTQLIAHEDYVNYYGCSISKNGLYLAYGDDEGLLKIYDMKLQKLNKQFKIDDCITVCKFTQDSSLLYIGQQQGYVCGYDVQDNFKEIYKQQIHSSGNQYIITCSNDESIIKTDIKSQQQMFKLTGHTDLIKAIDYNEKDQIIVSGSDDQSIKLWNCKNQSIIINEEQSHCNDITQIQFISNYQMLSLDLEGNLYKWRIDLINKDLIKIQKFKDQNRIFNFHLVNQDKNILLICDDYAKILNLEGETINILEHGGKVRYFNYDCSQLDDLKYILIRADNQIILATAND